MPSVFLYININDKIATNKKLWFLFLNFLENSGFIRRGRTNKKNNCYLHKAAIKEYHKPINKNTLGGNL